MKNLFRRTVWRFAGYLPAAAVLCVGYPGNAEQRTFTFADTQPAFSTDWSHTFSLPQFNPVWGTLDSVEVHVTYDFTASGTVFNNSQGTANFSLQKFSSLELALPGGLGTLDAEVTLPIQSYKLKGHSSDCYGPFSCQATVCRTYTGADMASFIGGGMNELLGSTTTWKVLDISSGDPEACLTTSASATIEIDYHDLVAVPEPSATGLWLLGAAGLVAWRNRRR